MCVILLRLRLTIFSQVLSSATAAAVEKHAESFAEEVGSEKPEPFMLSLEGTCPNLEMLLRTPEQILVASRIQNH